MHTTKLSCDPSFAAAAAAVAAAVAAAAPAAAAALQVRIREAAKFMSAAEIAQKAAAESAADRAYQDQLLDSKNRPRGPHPMMRNVSINLRVWNGAQRVGRLVTSCWLTEETTPLLRNVSVIVTLGEGVVDGVTIVWWWLLMPHCVARRLVTRTMCRAMSITCVVADVLGLPKHC